MSRIQLQLIQSLRDRYNKNSKDGESDSVEFVFSCIASFILIAIGTMLIICFFAAAEQRSSVPSSGSQQAVLQCSDTAN